MTINWRSPTIAIAAVTSIISLLILLPGYQGLAAGAMGFIPARASGILDLSSAVPVLLTPFSCTLVHGGLLHLLFNMMMLLLCGIAVERVLGAQGLVVIYLVSAVTSALAQWAVLPLGVIPVIGASGAISGVIGAYALSFGRPKQVSRNPSINRLIHIVWLAVAWTVLQIGVGYAAGTEGMMLATPAHIAGFITGLLLQRPLLLWRYRSA
ncbi:rhomboid family intramembrane serine protease [Sphingomonas sp. KRR8]|uniref:rhomboid family intramembrane serine protease n=1 Tax=Sphingomonas sp. KRR8 TaxID=2942996 RepID=UPI0020202617|nr:rhomboid family intramembrane serine protease [Sphingomonas sp. KRR8]URD61310.1 rhomboid family intramembrane serine protease [Sphingomonas sp. KRR8]